MIKGAFNSCTIGASIVVTIEHFEMIGFYAQSQAALFEDYFYPGVDCISSSVSKSANQRR